MVFKKVINDLFWKLGIDIKKVGNTNIELENYIRKFYHEDFFFVQIGANDGKMSDPIYRAVKKLKLKGILVEPVKEYFYLLKQNYKGFESNLIFINKAICEKREKRFIYKVKKEKIKEEWMQGIASLDKDFYKKSGLLTEEDIEQEVIECITFDDLFTNYDIYKIDLLLIDTEGYDYYLLKIFPFSKFVPKIIQFEHGLQAKTMTKEQVSEIVTMLINLGYYIHMNNWDVIAWRTDS
jgi:FkbM family methyltransferase